MKPILDSRDGAKKICIVVLFIFFTNCMPIPAWAAVDHGGQGVALVQLMAPAENKVHIQKKPQIKAVFTQPIDLKTLFIMLDGIDITQLAAVNAQGFSYAPIQVLEPGGHTLMVSGTSARGESFNQEFGFTTRHYQAIETGYSQNELTAVAQGAFAKSDSMEEQVPDVKFEANWRNTSKMREKGFELSFNANARYLDQDIAPTPPEETGGDIIDFLLSANYTRGAVTTHAELGDTNVVLSENTLPSLQRRGGQLSINTDTAAVGVFSANSEQAYGSKGGLGIESDSNKHIYGWYGNLNLLDNRLRFKLVHSAGGETGSSFGTATLEPDKKGRVSGAVLCTDFLEGKLVTEFEYDRSEFDEDTSDTQGAEKDKAYRMQLQGGIERYNYGVVYKYIGPHYGVAGNQGLEKDRAGFTLNGGAGFERHMVSLAYGRYKDNVDDDATRPVMDTDTCMVDYTYSGIENVSITLAYQKEMAGSSQEPVLFDPTDRDTDTLSSGISYTRNTWTFGLQGSYAATDDQTDLDLDTTNLNIAFMPQYFTETLSLSPNLTFNQTKDHSADVTTDSYTLGLGAQGRLFKDKFSYGIGGTLDFTSTNDDSVDQRTTVYYINLDYKIGDRIWGYITPVVSLQGESNEIDDQVYDQITRDYAFKLVFSSTALFSF